MRKHVECTNFGQGTSPELGSVPRCVEIALAEQQVFLGNDSGNMTQGDLRHSSPRPRTARGSNLSPPSA